MNTTMQKLLDNWKTMSRTDFDEYLLNNHQTLLREEKEQILDAYNSCLSKGNGKEFIVTLEDYECAKRWWAMTYEEDKSIYQSTLF